jgi:hypothetical protein
MYDTAKVLLKTFSVSEVRRINGAWFITKSKMLNNQTDHTTELFLDDIKVNSVVPDDDLTVRALERQ